MPMTVTPNPGTEYVSLNISQMNEDCTWTGSRALSAESVTLSQHLRGIQLMTPQREDANGLQFPPMWLNGCQEMIPKHDGELMGKGEFHCWTTLHYFLSHHLYLLPTPPPVLTNSVQKRCRSHAESLQSCSGSTAFLLYPMECKDIADIHLWPPKINK